MFKILGRTSGNLVDIAVENDLTAKDFSALRDELDPLIEEHGKVRILFDLSGLERFEGDALWDASSFAEHPSVERVAVVAAPEHAERARAAFSLGADETRAFAPEQAKQAWRWVSEPAS